jgi:hypothetical protein
VGPRDHRLKTYQNVFVGAEAVDWLVERYPLSRENAVLLMRELQRNGWLVHVRNEHDFTDDHVFFLWKDANRRRSLPEAFIMPTHVTLHDSNNAAVTVPLADALLWWKYHVLLPSQLVTLPGAGATKVADLELIFKLSDQIRLESIDEDNEDSSAQ